ncbi:MAG: hypothetical protein HY097_00020 [Nitrospinae bacterium]|nr:hypothetical protein [Nitrospinota bacterium]MBI3813700.1 hypothetical protein [Nitrospinota bacterium]
MMRKMFVVAAALLIAFASNAMAASRIAIGEVTAVDKDKNTVTVKTDKEGDKTCVVDPNTYIKSSDDKPASLADVKVGSKVSTKYEIAGGKCDFFSIKIIK